ncbi:MAG: hypothetical protein WC683_14270 [bacterium]
MTPLAAHPPLPVQSAPFHLLTPPKVEPAAMQQEITKACSQAQMVGLNMVPELLPLVQQLGRLSSEWNAPYFDSILYEHIRHYKDPAKVKERLSAEIDFFHALYRPAKRFRIYPVDEHWFDDHSVFPTIIFASGGRVFGCADFVSLPEAMVLEYIQGASFSTSSEQRAMIGRPWFEAFMERAIESHSRLHNLGIRMMLRIEEGHYLPRMVRDRYFERLPASGRLHALATNRERVRRSLDGL